MFIEICPKCGHDLQNEIIATYPPIPAKRCFNCGYNWIGEPQKIEIRVFEEDKRCIKEKKMEDMK